MKIPERLKSRKLWMALGGVVAVMLTDWLNMSPELTENVVSAVVIIIPSYLAGQGLVDCFSQWRARDK
jgi:hypothetical protein